MFLETIVQGRLCLGLDGSPLLAVYAPLTGEASLRVGLVPFFPDRAGGPLGLCAFSAGPLHGWSVCLVFFQSVCWRGSSFGFFFAHGGTSQGQP